MNQNCLLEAKYSKKNKQEIETRQEVQDSEDSEQHATKPKKQEQEAKKPNQQVEMPRLTA